MKRIYVCALTLLMAVSMLFMSACDQKPAGETVGKASGTTTGLVGEGVGTTIAAENATTTITVGGSVSATDSTATTLPTSATQTGAVLTKPTKTGTTASVSADPTAAFVAQFEEWLLNLTDYQKPTPKVVKVSDGTITSYALKGAKYTAEVCVHIHSNADKSIGAVYVTVAEKDYDFMFPVVSYYVYDSLGLKKLDADGFLAQFDAFPDTLTLANKSESGYRMSCVKPDEFLTFAVLGKGALSATADSVSAHLQSVNCNGCYADKERAMNYMELTDKAATLGVDVAMLERALVSVGNRARLASVMQRAQNGEELTIGFIGGSVTEGAYASDYNKTSYAGLTFAWWEKAFPQATFHYVNAGFGGTSSLFGVHRVQEDLLQYEPDFVIVEFGVNDCTDPYQTEAYANLVHRILNSASAPAVMLLYVMNSDGSNTQAYQVPVGEHYDLPMISYRDAVWPEVKAGRYLWDEIGADWVHPTNMGHAIIAELVISYLTKTHETLATVTEKAPSYSNPYKAYVYENAIYYNRNNITPTHSEGIREMNKKNISWSGNAGSSVIFTFTGKRCIVAIPTDYKDSMDVSVRIDGGAPIKLESYLFHGGSFANYLVLNGDEVSQHTIEIICHSGTMYIGGLFVS